jgi:hypothetical protein
MGVETIGRRRELGLVPEATSQQIVAEDDEAFDAASSMRSTTARIASRAAAFAIRRLLTMIQSASPRSGDSAPEDRCP